MNSNLYSAINTMLNASGSDIAELVNFHFKQEEEKVVNKEMKEEIKEEIKKEIKEEIKKEVKAKNAWKPYQSTTNRKWGDYSDDEEDDVEDEAFPPLSTLKEESEGSDEGKNSGSYLKVLSNSVVVVDSNKKPSPEDLKGFVTKTSARKQSLPVVYTVGEFIEEIKLGNKPNKDFIIDEDAHCKHTYEGTLCENVRVCGKIHVQRCTRGEDCSAKHCSYLHSWDMRDDDADRMFRRTMRKYNALKSAKQVKL
jgi:uncharacterized protein YdaU (DUF1376 family)